MLKQHRHISKKAVVIYEIIREVSRSIQMDNDRSTGLSRPYLSVEEVSFAGCQELVPYKGYGMPGCMASEILICDAYLWHVERQKMRGKR
jgi:hypothetical protein